ncbi:DUF3883 domain-containing protein [Firmicutes bacterium AM43-11BH]|nr:DUF3883 domain-containing protein [Firmicutes bacterium AM43-11BH]
MYDHRKQLKCSIIRARAISDVDNLLPKYATVIDNLCPCTKAEFEEGFNNAFREYAISKARNKSNEKAIKKTLDNHRTEVSGSLFGMHYEVDGMVYSSERNKKFLEDNDQPAFFKDWLLKMQFPNGMQKSQTYLKMVEEKVCCHPYSILLRVLEYARRSDIVLLKQELGYYIFNSEDVLRGNATVNEVFDQIMNDKRGGIPPRKIIIPDGESTSYDQHVGDQLKYLQLANLVYIDGQEVKINPHEMKAINRFIELINKPLGFDVYKYDLSNVENRKRFETDWAIYYGQLSKYADDLATPVESLLLPVDEEPKKIKRTNYKVELGDEGEEFVLNFEKDRVSKFNAHLVNKVIGLGKTKGLGYDIQSVIAEPGDSSEFVKYIEVKSTKRVTAPDLKDEIWTDTINITRNEWIAAMQHKEFYSIYRVYFIRGGVVMYIIKNPYQKKMDNIIDVVPLTYRVDFQNNSIDESYKEVNGNV